MEKLKDYSADPVIDLLLIFTNKGYKFPKRVLVQAIETNWFKNIIWANESWLKNESQAELEFCKSKKYDGYGLWIWKPVIISLQLSSMKENETLLYCDTGVYLNLKGYKKLAGYLEYLKEKNKDAFFFSIESGHGLPKYYSDIHESNRNLIQDMDTDYPGEFVNQIYSGLMLLRNTQATRDFINCWKALCLNSALLSETKDADNGLLNFSRHPSLKFTVCPGNEVNLYEASGLQSKHALSSIEYGNRDWTGLLDSPFQLRRID